jgi:hypothetical protein
MRSTSSERMSAMKGEGLFVSENRANLQGGNAEDGDG